LFSRRTTVTICWEKLNLYIFKKYKALLQLSTDVDWVGECFPIHKKISIFNLFFTIFKILSVALCVIVNGLA